MGRLRAARLALPGCGVADTPDPSPGKGAAVGASGGRTPLGPSPRGVAPPRLGPSSRWRADESAPSIPSRTAFVRDGSHGVRASSTPNAPRGVLCASYGGFGARPPIHTVVRIFAPRLHVFAALGPPANVALGPCPRRSLDPMEIPRSGAGSNPTFTRETACWLPFQSFAPRSDRFRLPGPGPLEVRPPCSRTACAPFRALVPDAECRPVLADLALALLGFLPLGCSPPPLWLRHDPGHPPSRFRSRRPSTVATRHPGVLRRGGVGWPLGCRPFWDSRPCGR